MKPIGLKPKITERNTIHTDKVGGRAWFNIFKDI